MTHWGNGSKDLKTASTSSSDEDPLDALSGYLKRADKATDLLEYSADFDEPTGKHEIHVHVPPQPSQPDVESIPAPAKGIRHVLGGVNSWAHVAAIAVIVAGLIAWQLLKPR